MCGIVGYLGPGNSIDIVLEGLTRLEYRGYDSAGICLQDANGSYRVYKKIGKIQNLKKLIVGLDLQSHMAIGHTRWATHGPVTDLNAHPHNNDDIALVHNGIIENATALRKELEDLNFKFKSETDSEVFLVLIEKKMQKGLSFKDAVLNAFKRITGNSAFVIMNRHSREIVAIKRAAPMVCGTSENGQEVLASSDPYALVGVAKQLYFPEDEVLAVLNPTDKKAIQFFELDGSPSARFVTSEQRMSLEASEKGEYEHHMLKEIHEQPHLVSTLIGYYLEGEGKKILEELANNPPKAIHIAACGTAWHAGLMIRDLIEKINRIPVHIELASEFRYRNPILNEGEWGLFISQSGETADTLAAQKLVKEQGLKTVSIVNVEGSTLYRECDVNLLIKAGVEIGVASTKAFNQMVLTGYLLSQALGGNIDHIQIRDELLLLIERMEGFLAREKDIMEIAQSIHNYNGFFFTGRGSFFPVAMEGALKLKEIAYVHAEGYASGELKHGPLALIDENMVNIALIGNELYEKTLSNVEELKTRKAIIVTVGPEEKGEALAAISHYYFPIRYQSIHYLAPMLPVLFVQLISYYIALFKGTDIDQPRNLAKSVTVE